MKYEQIIVRMVEVSGRSLSFCELYAQARSTRDDEYWMPKINLELYINLIEKLFL